MCLDGEIDLKGDKLKQLKSLLKRVTLIVRFKNKLVTDRRVGSDCIWGKRKSGESLVMKACSALNGAIDETTWYAWGKYFLIVRIMNSVLNLCYFIHTHTHYLFIYLFIYNTFRHSHPNKESGDYLRKRRY